MDTLKPVFSEFEQAERKAFEALATQDPDRMKDLQESWIGAKEQDQVLFKFPPQVMLGKMTGNGQEVFVDESNA